MFVGGRKWKPIKKGKYAPKAGFVLLFALNLLGNKIKTAENQTINSRLQYPEPGSNRHALRHWCLRPARLPIPPSGHRVSKTMQKYYFYLNLQVFVPKTFPLHSTNRPYAIHPERF